MSWLADEVARLNAMTDRQFTAHLLREGFVPLYCQECGLRLSLVSGSRPFTHRVRVKPHGTCAGVDEVEAESLTARPGGAA